MPNSRLLIAAQPLSAPIRRRSKTFWHRYTKWHIPRRTGKEVYESAISRNYEIHAPCHGAQDFRRSDRSGCQRQLDGERDRGAAWSSGGDYRAMARKPERLDTQSYQRPLLGDELR